MTDECSTISCCILYDFIEKTFSLFVHFDQCNMKLSLRIEKYERNFSLFEYKFGEEHTLDLFGVVKIR